MTTGSPEQSRCKQLVLAGMVFLNIETAKAFFDPPQIVPALPTTDSVIDVRVRAGVCDSFLTTGPEDRELELIGNRVVIRALGFSTEDLAQCNAPPLTFRYRIGKLPAGNYQLELYRIQFEAPEQVDLVGTAEFTVQNTVVNPPPFIDPPQIVPALPSTDSDIQVRIRAGVCVTLFTVGPEDRELEVNGNVVTLRMRGLTTEDLAQCIYPSGTFRYRIGQLPAGRYDLQIYIKQAQFPGVVDLVQTGSFTVGPSPAIAIPATGPRGLLLLLGLLGAVGAGALFVRPR